MRHGPTEFDIEYGVYVETESKLLDFPFDATEAFSPDLDLSTIQDIAGIYSGIHTLDGHSRHSFFVVHFPERRLLATVLWNPAVMDPQRAEGRNRKQLRTQNRRSIDETEIRVKGRHSRANVWRVQIIHKLEVCNDSSDTPPIRGVLPVCAQIADSFPRDFNRHEEDRDEPTSAPEFHESAAIVHTVALKEASGQLDLLVFVEHQQELFGSRLEVASSEQHNPYRSVS
jgi:hypothetical protein